jgi:hypothetical protein
MNSEKENIQKWIDICTHVWKQIQETYDTMSISSMKNHHLLINDECEYTIYFVPEYTIQNTNMYHAFDEYEQGIWDDFGAESNEFVDFSMHMMITQKYITDQNIHMIFLKPHYFYHQDQDQDQDQDPDQEFDIV